jgi:transcriptional regulator with XRE-family HTH domain
MGVKQPKRSEAESLEDVIKARIKTLGLSAYAVGKQSGINAVVIQRFLNGERGINLATADKLCQALDLVLVERPGRTMGRDSEETN